MPLVPALCTQCGAQLTVDNTKEACICSHCGTAFITEKAINNYNVSNYININSSGNTINVIQNDNTRFPKDYTISISRNYHLLKGCRISYTLEIDGKKYNLFNGDSIAIHTNLKEIDIQITKKTDGIDWSFGQLVGKADGNDIQIEIDVTLGKKPVFEIVSCNKRDFRLI